MRFPAAHSTTSSQQAVDTCVGVCYKCRPRGAVAQLGERLNGIQEVVGSIPIGSTSNLQLAALRAAFLASAVASRNLTSGCSRAPRAAFHGDE